MRKIGILTTFGHWDEAYSLVGVVKHQILSLHKHGYTPILFVLDTFNEAGFPYKDICELRKTIPQITTEPYQGVAATRQVPQQFEKDVAKVQPEMEASFKDLDILLCHDIIFQDSFLPYNAALRKMILPPKLKMFHWMHSGASLRPGELTEPISYLYTVPPQSTIIYMNGYDIVRTAEMYGLYPKDVRIVHNPIDWRTLNVHPIIHQIIENFDLYSADIIGVYPLSTTRMGSGGKQLQKAIKIMGKLKAQGKVVKYIVPNAHANADREKEAVKEMIAFAGQYGLTEKDICFTSTLGKNWEHGVPHEVVLQLFQLADLFIFPSVSENCPLILLEAALTKNLLVLNEDFSPMKEFVGNQALYFKFDSINTVTTHPRGEDNYYADVAKIIIAELNANRAYNSHRIIRQKYNMDYIFKNELEPLFFEEKVEEGVVMEVTPNQPLNMEVIETEFKSFIRNKYGAK